MSMGTNLDLGLEEVRVVADRGTEIEVVNKQAYVSTCPVCGGDHVKRTATKVRRLHDIIIKQHAYRKFDLMYRHTIYKCLNPSCSANFLIPVSFARPKTNMTCRFEDYVAGLVMRHSFSEAAKIAGISSGSAKNVFARWVADKEAARPAADILTPSTLGIHILHVGQHDYVAVLNVAEMALIDLLPDCEPTTIQTFLGSLSKLTIKQVVVDLDERIIGCVLNTLPGTTLVTSPSYFLRIIDEELIKEFKKHYRGISAAPVMEELLVPSSGAVVPRKIKPVIQSWPVIRDLYTAKCSLYSIVTSSWNPDAYDNWYKSLPKKNPAISRIVLKLDMYKEELAGSYTSTTPPDYVAQINEFGARIGTSYGCQFAVVRARALYSADAQYATPGTFAAAQPGTTPFAQPISNKKYYVGVPLGAINAKLAEQLYDI